MPRRRLDYVVSDSRSAVMLTSPATVDTFPKLLLAHAERRGTQPAIRQKRRGLWRTVTWQALGDEVVALAVALAARGVQAGTRVAFIGDNRPRLFAGIAATQALGGIATPLFQDASAEELLEPLRAAEVTHVFAENQEQVDKLLAVLPECPALRCIVFDDDRSMAQYRQPSLVHYDVLLGEGRSAAAAEQQRLRDAIGRADGTVPAFLFFTARASGTSKGVVFDSATLIERMRTLARIEGLSEADTSMAYLPPGWLCQTLFSYVLPTVAGSCVCCPESSDTLLGDIREIAPTCFLATPRMLATIVSQVSLRIEAAGGVNLALYRRAVALAERIGARSQAGQSPALGDRLASGLYDVLIYGPLRDALGMTRVKVAYSVGDVIDPALLTFFRALGVNLKQLYGSTETGFTVAMHRNGAVAPDSVGAPLDGVELAFTAGEEVLVRSPGLFREYLGNAEATRRARDEGGWFATGDIGRIGSDGQLRIIDRAGDVGTLTDGAFFSPRQIENRIKASPYVREAIALGAGRGMVCAMIDINTPAVGRWADGQGISFTGHADLASREEVLGLIAGVLAEANAQMARDPAYAACQVHRFLLLPKELDADDGVLTRTGKIRRDVVAERFAGLIEALYGGRDVAPNPFAGEVHGGDTEAGDVRIGDVRVVSTAGARRAA